MADLFDLAHRSLTPPGTKPSDHDQPFDALLLHRGQKNAGCLRKERYLLPQHRKAFFDAKRIDNGLYIPKRACDIIRDQRVAHIGFKLLGACQIARTSGKSAHCVITRQRFINRKGTDARRSAKDKNTFRQFNKPFYSNGAVRYFSNVSAPRRSVCHKANATSVFSSQTGKTAVLRSQFIDPVSITAGGKREPMQIEKEFWAYSGESSARALPVVSALN
jgi:hypothetical protein